MQDITSAINALSFSYSSTDCHTVASLLKLYIRELPEPIIPFSKYTQFLSCAQLLAKDKEMVIKISGYHIANIVKTFLSLVNRCIFLVEGYDRAQQTGEIPSSGQLQPP